MAGSEDDRPSIPSEVATGALLVLLIAEREERLWPERPRRPTELLLADAGLSLGEIAQVTGRKYEAVKATIRRARQKGTDDAT
ncbi:MAG: hypothetical protein JWN67_1688 [Actinomycetia bacterium]|nr:hypothetical protein [Actinomycetes bacterium]